MFSLGSEPSINSRNTVTYQPLVIVFIAACIGIGVDRVIGLPIGYWFAATIVCWIVWFCFWHRNLVRSASAVLLVAVAAVAGAWHHCQWSLVPDNELISFAIDRPEPACVEAIVTRGVRRIPAPEQIVPQVDRSELEVDVVAIRDGTRWHPASGHTRLTVDGHLLGIHVGDRLQIFAKLSSPSPPKNPGGFDAVNYARSDRIFTRLWSSFPSCVSIVEKRRGWSPRRCLEELRSAGNRILKNYLGSEQKELASAVLLGAREGLSSQQRNAFQETGTAHLLAISGLHIGIVAMALFLLLRILFVSRGTTAIIVSLVTISYALITDVRPPAIRATILVLVFCFSLYAGRRTRPFNSLAAAALVVLAINPCNMFRLGPQLSFLAVAGLIWLAPLLSRNPKEQDPLEKLTQQTASRPKRLIHAIGRRGRELILISAVIWFLTMPLILYTFHVFTPLAILLNAVLWIPMIMSLISGLGVLTFGWACPALACALAFVCKSSFWVLAHCIDFAQSIPYGHFWVPGPAGWWVAGFYIGLLTIAVFPKIRPSRRWCIALLAGWTTIGLAPQMFRSNESQLDCTFVSVGHGLAVILELPSGQTMLYDCGSFSPPEFSARSSAKCLWSKGHTRVDAVIISHADADHYNALPNLLKYFSVGTVYVTPTMQEKMLKSESGYLKALKTALREHKVPVQTLHEGKRLYLGKEGEINVLHPPQQLSQMSDNANSIILDVSYGGRHVLLTGDLESSGLGALTSSKPIKCDVVLSPHHGSVRSKPFGLFKWSSPDYIIVSGGRRSGLTSQEVARMTGAQVFNTNEVGAVRVRLSKAQTLVTGFINKTGRAN